VVDVGDVGAPSARVQAASVAPVRATSWPSASQTASGQAGTSTFHARRWASSSTAIRRAVPSGRARTSADQPPAKVVDRPAAV
jgi:hypothetical protein